MSKWTKTIDALAYGLRQRKIYDKLCTYYRPIAILLEKKGSQKLELPITDCKNIVIIFNTKNRYVDIEEEINGETTYNRRIEIRDEKGKLYRNWKKLLFNRITNCIECRI